MSARPAVVIGCLLLGALAPSSAAAGTRVRGAVDLTITPGAASPLGIGFGVDVLRETNPRSTVEIPRPGFSRVRPQLALGGGLRVDTDLHGDAVRVLAEPILAGVISDVGWKGAQPVFQTLWMVDVRPGLAYRTHGGPALTLAGNVDIGLEATQAVAHIRADASFPLLRESKRPPRSFDGTFEDGTLAVGLGAQHDMTPTRLVFTQSGRASSVGPHLR